MLTRPSPSGVMKAQRASPLYLAVLSAVSLALRVSGDAYWISSLRPGSRLPTSQQPAMAWRDGARANISAWQTSLFINMMQMYKQNTLMAGGLAKMGGKKFAMEPASLHPNQQRRMFDIMNATITCPPPGVLSTIGGRLFRNKSVMDGHKYVCNLASIQAPCLVVSLGSNGDTTFERAILDQTPCDISTFDCTVPPVQPLSSRHKFFRKCIGNADTAAASNGLFVTWQQAVALSGHTRVELLKIDIEAFEYDVLSTFTPQDQTLPNQIAIEMHLGFWHKTTTTGLLQPGQHLTLAQFAVWATHFAHLGYGVVNRDDNPVFSSGSEFLLHRVPPA